ncbi:MAG: spore-associated protein A [Actinomycetota bacterium]|nr:spore-associated protein A [Actinomycetota bacterium]
MRRAVRNATSMAAVMGVVIAAGVLVPGVASAATYNGECGAGFGAGSRIDLAGGTVFLASKGDLRCAVTILNTPNPAGTSMSVWIRASYSEGWISDPGTWTRYAGPVITSTYGCADYGGRIGTSQQTRYDVCW